MVFNGDADIAPDFQGNVLVLMLLSRNILLRGTAGNADARLAMRPHGLLLGANRVVARMAGQSGGGIAKSAGDSAVGVGASTAATAAAEGWKGKDVSEKEPAGWNVGDEDGAAGFAGVPKEPIGAEGVHETEGLAQGGRYDLGNRSEQNGFE
jgi:hypothetical protein